MAKNNIKAIAELIKTRTVIQVRSHLQKYKIKLEKMQSNNNPNSENEPISKDIEVSA